MKINKSTMYRPVYDSDFNNMVDTAENAISSSYSISSSHSTYSKTSTTSSYSISSSYAEYALDSTGLVYRLTVGASGSFQTLNEAVEYYNNSGSVCHEILVDAGPIEISDTITVNNTVNSLAGLTIRGLGVNATRLRPATGLTGKPMFDIKTECNFRSLRAEGSFLTDYGTLDNEDFIQFTSGSDIYCEFVDILIDNFKVGINDVNGNDLFLFNFIVSNCDTGVKINHTGSGYSDLEIGNFEDCNIGIDLASASNDEFIFRNLIFKNPELGIGIQYDGINYTYGTFSEIDGCSYNKTGSFMSGFEFERRDGRDANIYALNNIGSKNYIPKAKLNIIDNTETTTITNTGTYYKLNGLKSKTRIKFNEAATAGTFTITIDDQTTGNINYDASASDIKTAIELLSNITTVSVTEIVASKEWTIQFDTDEQGWVNQSVDISGLTTTTSAEVIKNFFTINFKIDQNKFTFLPNKEEDIVIYIAGNVSANNNNRNVGIGLRKNGTGEILNPFTVRTFTADQPYGFSIVTYLDEVDENDYFELMGTSSTSGDIIRVQDLSLFIEGK